MDELKTLYAAETEGQARELPELPVEYEDYVRWQRRMVDGAAGHARVEAVEASVGGGDKLVGGGGLRVAGEGDESEERQQETLRHVDASSRATSI